MIDPHLLQIYLILHSQLLKSADQKLLQQLQQLHDPPTRAELTAVGDAARTALMAQVGLSLMLAAWLDGEDLWPESLSVH